MQVPESDDIFTLAVRGQQRVAIETPVEAEELAVLGSREHVLRRGDALVIDSN